MVKTRRAFLGILHKIETEISPFVKFAQNCVFPSVFRKNAFTKPPHRIIIDKNTPVTIR